MKAVVLCEKFGWTYEEYLNQPFWLTTLAFERMKIDARNK